MAEELIPLTAEELAIDIAVMVAAKVIKLPDYTKREMRDAERERFGRELAKALHERGVRFMRVKPPLGNQ